MAEARAAAQPLLDEEGWSDVEDLEPGQAGRSLTVAELFQTRPHDTVAWLQRRGMAKLGEFMAADRLVFPAFAKDPLLTLGAASIDINYEQAWQRELEARSAGAAAAGGKSKRASRGAGWAADVAVEAYVVNLRHAAAPDCDGLLQPLLKRWQTGRCSYKVFGLPAVQAVINWKWWTYCRTLLLVELAFFALWLGAFNVWTIAFQDEDLSLSLSELLATARGKLEVAAQALAVLGMLPFLLLEVGTLYAYGLGWLDLWNFVDLLTYLNQAAITTMHLGRWGLKSSWLSVLPAVQLILLVFRLQYFFQAFRPTRFAFLDTVRAVFNDMKAMFFYMLLVMWAFGSAFHVIFRREQEETEDYDTIMHSFAAMFQHQGGLELKPMYDSKSPYVATTLACIYGFVMGMILLNLLVGIVVNSLEKATEDAETKMLFSQARIIDEIESNIPNWLERRMAPRWYPEFVHVLRINPEKLDQVRAAVGLWERAEGEGGKKEGEAGEASDAAGEGAADDGKGEGSSSPAAATNGAASEARELRASVATLQRKLDAQSSLLEEQGALLREVCAALQAQSGSGGSVAKR